MFQKLVGFLKNHVSIIELSDMARSIYDFDENQFDVEDHFEFLVPYEEGITIPPGHRT